MDKWCQRSHVHWILRHLLFLLVQRQNMGLRLVFPSLSFNTGVFFVDGCWLHFQVVLPRHCKLVWSIYLVLCRLAPLRDYILASSCSHFTLKFVGEANYYFSWLQCGVDKIRKDWSLEAYDTFCCERCLHFELLHCPSYLFRQQWNVLKNQNLHPCWAAANLLDNNSLAIFMDVQVYSSQISSCKYSEFKIFLTNFNSFSVADNHSIYFFWVGRKEKLIWVQTRRFNLVDVCLPNTNLAS